MNVSQVKKVLVNKDRAIVELSLPQFSYGILGHASIWILLDRKLKIARKLELKSGDSSLEIEEFFFSEGYLKFNDKEGVYIAKFNIESWYFDRISIIYIPEDIVSLIDQFIKNSCEN